MKMLSTLILGFSFISASFALAGPLTEQAERISDRLQSVEQELSRRDADEVYRALDRAEYLLERYGRDTSLKLSCLANGRPAGFESYFITNLDTNAKMGGGTDLSTCKDLLQNQKNGYICLSDGRPSGFERFSISEVKGNRAFGGLTDLSTCKDLVAKSTSSFLCVSNGRPSGFESFTLINTRTNTPIGAAGPLSNCLGAIPR